MEKQVALKTSVDVARIRRACRVAERCLRLLKDQLKPGVTTAGLDRFAARFLEDNGAVSALKGYRGYPGSICTSVNNVAAHGVPSTQTLEDGDVITIDITVGVGGWFGDAAWTYIVGQGSPDARRILKGAWAAGLAGVAAAKAGERLGSVGWAVQEAARKLGCAVLEDYVGHGIGRAMHEDPIVPNFGQRNRGTRIVAGMTFTVEPIVSLGKPEARLSTDGWTLVTADGSLSAQFEHTVAIFRDYTEVLTFSDGDIGSYIDFPPYF